MRHGTTDDPSYSTRLTRKNVNTSPLPLLSLALSSPSPKPSLIPLFPPPSVGLTSAAHVPPAPPVKNAVPSRIGEAGTHSSPCPGCPRPQVWCDTLAAVIVLDVGTVSHAGQNPCSIWSFHTAVRSVATISSPNDFLSSSPWPPGSIPPHIHIHEFGFDGGEIYLQPDQVPSKVSSMTHFSLKPFGEDLGSHHGSPQREYPRGNEPPASITDSMALRCRHGVQQPKASRVCCQQLQSR